VITVVVWTGAALVTVISFVRVSVWMLLWV
jgi:hypothetical protein